MKNKLCIKISLILSVVSCMTERQRCYSQSSDALRSCMIDIEITNNVSEDKLGIDNITIPSCFAYITKESSCSDKDNVIPLNPKR
ncbi:hypothetical protein Lepto782_23075 (plasmid) [Leptospira interrogans serovar Canicola]|uniref:Uncharacterized protein n=1 Tax=Leptospira interrogans serovar Canicola TaxID=211880 RepID=A0AAQ0B0Z8_LEPIR|nr:hypothetical protein [Leptospira interrogans]QOI45068.1 hypothetical protein Lepto782_23075 [Leptospira interrogans serovar Canicola]